MAHPQGHRHPATCTTRQQSPGHSQPLLPNGEIFPRFGRPAQPGRHHRRERQSQRQPLRDRTAPVLISQARAARAERLNRRKSSLRRQRARLSPVQRSVRHHRCHRHAQRQGGVKIDKNGFRKWKLIFGKLCSNGPRCCCASSCDALASPRRTTTSSGQSISSR